METLCAPQVAKEIRGRRGVRKRCQDFTSTTISEFDVSPSGEKRAARPLYFQSTTKRGLLGGDGESTNEAEFIRALAHGA